MKVKFKILLKKVVVEAIVYIAYIIFMAIKVLKIIFYALVVKIFVIVQDVI